MVSYINGWVKNNTKINGHQKFTESDADIAYMLQMQQNQVHYISLIDVFAPCIVFSSVWNNDVLMGNTVGIMSKTFRSTCDNQ